MKNRFIISLIYVFIGILLILTPTVLFPVCSSNDMKMACYYTAKAEIGLGILIIFSGILSFISKNSNARTGISLSQLGTAALILIYPVKLTGLCGMKNMTCHVQTLPMLIVITFLLFIVSAANIIYLIRKDKKSDDEIKQ